MKLFYFLTIILIGTSSWASITLPSDFSQLEGAYKGKGATSNKDAYLLVYNIKEDGQVSGRYNMFLLTNDRNQGQVLEAEFIGGTSIAVLVDGVSASQRYIEAKLPPAGILETSFDRRNNPVLKLSKQDNASFLQESYVFDEDSKDIRINPANPQGRFNSREDAMMNTPGVSGTLNVEAQVNSLNLTGKYVGIFELSGVMVLRKQKLDNSLYQYNEGEISGILVSIFKGRDPMVIVGGLSDGKPAAVRVLPIN